MAHSRSLIQNGLIKCDVTPGCRSPAMWNLFCFARDEARDLPVPEFGAAVVAKADHFEDAFGS